MSEEFDWYYWSSQRCKGTGLLYGSKITLRCELKKKHEGDCAARERGSKEIIRWSTMWVS